MSMATARSMRETPYRHESERRTAERLQEEGTMPKDLAGLVRWYQIKAWEQTPAELHTSQVWRDRVAPYEDSQPVGASDTGALAYADDFRRLLENSPSEVDHQDAGTDGRVPYLRPVSSALSRMGRGKPLTVRVLLNLANNGFDWVALGEALSFPREMWEMYLKEALVCLWREHREFTRAG